jgi:hypothetical protein
MAMVCNLGRTDRKLRVVLGLCLGLTGILVNGHPWVGHLLGLAGALIILSAAGGT